MLLVIDAGNTNTSLGLFKGKQLLAHWRLSTTRDRTADEFGVLVPALLSQSRIKLHELQGILIASVVPPMNNALLDFCRRYCGLEAMVVGPGTKTGMAINYHNPHEVGADRIVNAVAAYDKYPTDLIVVDFGTATTFDCVSKEGAYIGGIIAPGIMVSYEALSMRTSKLPWVELFNTPKMVVGKDTVSAMNAGLVYGYAGLVDGVVKAINRERGLKCKVMATGGLATVIAAQSEAIEEVDDLLTLHGLRIIYERNQ